MKKLINDQKLQLAYIVGINLIFKLFHALNIFPYDYIKPAKSNYIALRGKSIAIISNNTLAHAIFHGFLSAKTFPILGSILLTNQGYIYRNQYIDTGPYIKNPNKNIF